jgi:hypothetical protein
MNEPLHNIGETFALAISQVGRQNYRFVVKADNQITATFKITGIHICVSANHYEFETINGSKGMISCDLLDILLS